MKMKPEYANRLANFGLLPHLTLRSRLIVMRRVARESELMWQETRETFGAELKRAEACMPFTIRKVEWIKEHIRQSRTAYKATMLELGRWFSTSDALLTSTYGFDGICDILEVNPVHRAEVLEYAEDRGRAISAVAFIAGMEESASRYSGRHPADYKDGPLFQTFLRLMMQMMADRPDAMPPLFGPDGFFDFTRQADGTLKRNPPTLTVHNADGTSKVVNAKQGVGNAKSNP